MIEENYHLYLTTVDGRVHSTADIEKLVIAWFTAAIQSW